MLDVGLHENITHDVYHSDPCAVPTLSAHTAIEMLAKSPAHAFAKRGSFASTKEQDRGTLLHGFILGGGAEFVSVEADDWRTNKAKAERDAARAAGKVPVLAHVLDQIRKASDEIKRVSPVDFAQARTELTAIWKSGQAATLCRARVDSLFSDHMIVDLKTTDDAARACEGRNIVANGYHVQAAANLDAIETLIPEAAGRARFVLTFVEWEQPSIGITQREVRGELLELGRRQWRRAVEQWGACVVANKWPGYPSEIQPAECPPWALAQDMEREMARGVAAAGSPPIME